MSPFEVVHTIQSAGVGVVGLDLRRTVVVLRSVDDQDVGETAVIRQKHYESRFKNVVKNLLKSTNISHNKYASSVSWRKSRNCIVCMGHTYLGKQLFQSERI